MQNLIQIPVVLLLIAQLASAQERQIKLLNPDGTPATDAKVVAVLLTPGGVVDQDLKPRQTPNDRKEPLAELVNDNGTVTVVDAKAIVASNEQGFLFLPASAFGETAKLREWARVELDVSSIPEEKRADVRLNVIWMNSIIGAPYRIWTNSIILVPSPPLRTEPREEFRDAFETNLVKIVENPDWRFQPMISWSHSVAVATQSLRVPPGEVSVSVTSKEFMDGHSFIAEMPPRGFSVNIGLWRVPSGEVTQIAMPQFGAVEGMMESKSDLPDWGKSGNEVTEIAIHPAETTPLPYILHPSNNLEEYAARLVSDEGFEARQSRTVSGIAAAGVDGKYRMDLVPVGTFAFGKLEKIKSNPNDGQAGELLMFIELAWTDYRVPSPYSISANETTTLDLLHAARPAHIVPPDSDPPSRPNEGPVPANLPAGWAIAYEERTRIVDGKEVRVTVPLLVQRRPTDPFQQADEFNAPPNDPAPRNVAGEGRFSNDDLHVPGPMPAPDAATLLIQNWLRAVKDPSDQTELRKLLQDHLQQEFDANQISRQAEIERLQQLIGKSKEWLDKRKQRREEIIKKRIDALMRHHVPVQPVFERDNLK